MKELLELINSFGGVAILAALFVWSYFRDKNKNEVIFNQTNELAKQNKELLEQNNETNKTISKSIDAINNTTNVLKEYIINHDERAKKINENVLLIKKKIEKEDK